MKTLVDLMGQTKVSKKMVENLVKQAVFLNTVNTTDYQGDAKNAVAVSINRTNEATVVDYDTATGATAQVVQGGNILLPLNRDKAINELIDNYEADVVPANVIADRLMKFTRAFALDIDSAIIAEYVTNGTSSANTTAWTTSSVKDGLLDETTFLFEKGCVAGEMSIVVSPKVQGLLMKADDFIKASDLGMKTLMTGQIGEFNGVRLLVSNNMPVNVEAIIADNKALACVSAFKADPYVEDATGGSYIKAKFVKGRIVTGVKVIDANRCVIKKFA